MKFSDLCGVKLKEPDPGQYWIIQYQRAGILSFVFIVWLMNYLDDTQAMIAMIWLTIIGYFYIKGGSERVEYEEYKRKQYKKDNPTPDEYMRFLSSNWSKTGFIEFREQGALVAVAVTDRLENGLSAVYTFFDAGCKRRSLGTYAILRQIDQLLLALQQDRISIQRRWETFCMLTGKVVRLVAGTQTISGTCVGIDSRGALLVERDGRTIAHCTGQVVQWD